MDETPQERSRLSRPIAIGGSTGSTGSQDEEGREQADEASVAAYGAEGDLPPSPFDELSDGSPSPGGHRPVIDDPFGELLVGIAALVTAVAVFLPWYKSTGLLDATVTGWASGTWGPVVFFLSAAVVAIVGLRRAGIGLSFPVSHALVVEGIGWVSVIALIVKRFLTPSGFAVAGWLDGGFWLAIASSVGIALAAGRLSKDAPFVTVPGWFRSSAGKAGAAIVVSALAAGAAFGVMNDFGSSARPAGPGGGTGEQVQFEQGLPACVSEVGFPVPDGVTPESGFGREEPEKICTATFISELTVRQLDKRFRAALKQANWSFKAIEAATGNGGNNARIYAISAPECAVLQILNTQEARNVTLSLGPSFCQVLQTPQSPSQN